ncbi:alpha/beta fold hydrolase [Aeromicrobium sp. CF4.19]|uniref:alpha/beta fold hydrolase n=1 Tax=Aeromicrobium sp. CF4.19 TaxID=3373082 RepID=UPI003EE61D38
MERPAWFDAALAEEPEHRTVDVGGAAIAYRSWGPVGAPVTVLVHGGAAHAGWWDHVGPHLADQHRVLALDLSGHGRSGHRETYTLEQWAGEVLAVARSEDSDAPVVVGHSMGGFVALTAAREHGASLAGVVAIDSPVRQMSPEARAWLDSHPDPPPHKVHPTREAVLARFRTLPEDDATLEFVRRHIAEESIAAVEGGWSWRFDPRIFLSTRMEPSALAAAQCPVALLRGERGMATRDITATVARELGGGVPVTTVPDAGHHVMLDQPVALIAAINVLLGQWRRT